MPQGKFFLVCDAKFPMRFQSVSSMCSSDIDFFSMLFPANADNKFPLAGAYQTEFCPVEEWCSFIY